MPHPPEWHILDNDFAEANQGIPVPKRRTELNGAVLRIENLDKSDPPGYTNGGVPRAEAFNKNVFALTPAPCMPAIPVVCTVAGFDPATTPIQWRLVCRHVLCRHYNAGGFQYRSACEPFEYEWRGESRAASFTLFQAEDAQCSCTYNERTRVLGGHALLMVAVMLPAGTLLDYVHLRIAGTNPGEQDVMRYLNEQLQDYDQNVLLMLQAVFEHESSLRQFAANAQSATAMTFRRPTFHKDPAQPDCRVRFDWPDDPPNFPLATFDFGVGISQFTRVGNQRVSAEIAWDWRENIRRGANLFLDKLKRKYQPGITWMHWAQDAWAAYNGSGAAALAYAKALSVSPQGAKVSLAVVSEQPKIAGIQPPPPLGPPSDWVVMA